MTKPALIRTITPAAIAAHEQAVRDHRYYLAAHRILAADLTFPQFGTPGRRRTAVVDAIAEIIRECAGENSAI